MRNLLFLPILLILFSSCSKRLVPLTDSLRKEYNLTDEVMPSLQYYISQDVVFTRGTSSSKLNIKKGVIYDTKGKKVDEIIIYEKTPGICIDVVGSDLKLSYDKNESPVDFGVYPDYQKDFTGKIVKKDNPNYRLQADYWGPVSGEFMFGEKAMHTSSENRYAHLLVNLRNISNVEKKLHVARGRKVARS